MRFPLLLLARARSIRQWPPAPLPRAVLAITAGLATAALAGCSALTVTTGPSPSTEPTRSASSHPAVRSVFTSEQVTTAVGTVTGAVTGTVQITGTSDSGFAIAVLPTHTTGNTDREVELATSLRDIDCSLDNDSPRSRAVDFGQMSVATSRTMERPALEHSQGDLSYLTVLVLVDESSKRYCDPATMGIARLHWTRAKALTGLRAIDAGPRAAARGRVTTRGGRPYSYRVADDDQLDSVAARFGLTGDELLYLNPRSRSDDTMLFADDTLNLDPQNR